MDFYHQLIAVLVSIGLYRPWERVITILCRKYFKIELSQEVCVACAITMFIIVSSVISITVKS